MHYISKTDNPVNDYVCLENKHFSYMFMFSKPWTKVPHRMLVEKAFLVFEVN